MLLLRTKRNSRSGVTLLESVIALAVMMVAVSMYSTMVVSSSRQRVMNHDFPAASQAVRVVLENMRNEELQNIFALYNSDPADDPDGPGTAPGNRFEVSGFKALEESPDGLVGTINFPTFTNVDGIPELREDDVDEELGMPRDLNGDSIVDDLNHADDYILLPIKVEVDWQGKYGPRHIELFTMFAEIRK
ncbi:MAG: type II secretory pathway pseudopilin PulG [Planctomycetota bacterium]|jgi:type II secretory pathway pseudopilin PulG